MIQRCLAIFTRDFSDIFAVNNLDGINPVNIGGARDFGPVGDVGAAAIPFVTDRTEGLPLRGRPTFSVGFPRVQMQIFMQALRENGLLRVLAEPNLVAVSGQEASFLAGGEVPVPLATDERINAAWPEYEAALKAASVKYEAHIYPNTQHGFNNDTTPRYDQTAARLAWERTMAFFGKHLKA